MRTLPFAYYQDYKHVNGRIAPRFGAISSELTLDQDGGLVTHDQFMRLRDALQDQTKPSTGEGTDRGSYVIDGQVVWASERLPEPDISLIGPRAAFEECVENLQENDLRYLRYVEEVRTKFLKQTQIPQDELAPVSYVPDGGKKPEPDRNFIEYIRHELGRYGRLEDGAVPSGSFGGLGGFQEKSDEQIARNRRRLAVALKDLANEQAILGPAERRNVFVMPGEKALRVATGEEDIAKAEAWSFLSEEEYRKVAENNPFAVDPGAYKLPSQSQIYAEVKPDQSIELRPVLYLLSQGVPGPFRPRNDFNGVLRV